ncbi:mannitol dehydrogenase family protein [Propionibacteriaceae bacterium Y2011]|uniref:mannitol dehydrogenase family protein n=1 Tax=Microlunatus sp. Y2014 TaxID=3418488 RepID=UPI003B4D37E6
MTDARIVHLGLGAFFRAHQAWYTQLANDLGGEQWGINALTGRRPDAAEVLSAQGCRYTLLERGPDGDTPIDIRSIVAAGHGADPAVYQAAIADEKVALVTSTITEKGYLVDPADHERIGTEAPVSAIGRLVDGLRVRMERSGAPIAVVPCDNLTANGSHTAKIVGELAERTDPALAEWIGQHVSFVSTMVDRITPATTDADIADVQRLVGWQDRSPVITEPFSEWVLAGNFPGGRPAWEQVGATIVDDVEPYEQRKLWLLNGAHSLLAYLGLSRGHETIAQAMGDDTCVQAVHQVWADAAPCLPFDEAEITAATDALTDRFTNANIQHRLAQIAGDGSQKLPVRFVSVQRARLAGGLGIGQAFPTVVAAWLKHLATDLVNDPEVAPLQTELAGLSDPTDRAVATLRFLDDELAQDSELVADIVAAG